MKKIKAKQRRLQIILGEEISGEIDGVDFEEDVGKENDNLFGSSV